MDGGNADHAGAVTCRPTGDIPRQCWHLLNRNARNRPQSGLLQPAARRRVTCQRGLLCGGGFFGSGGAVDHLYDGHGRRVAWPRRELQDAQIAAWTIAEARA